MHVAVYWFFCVVCYLQLVVLKECSRLWKKLRGSSMKKALKRDIQYVDHVQWVCTKMESVALLAKSVLSYTGQSGLGQHLHKIVMESTIVYS